jgi:hypothetical protein
MTRTSSLVVIPCSVRNSEAGAGCMFVRGEADTEALIDTTIFLAALACCEADVAGLGRLTFSICSAADTAASGPVEGGAWLLRRRVCKKLSEPGGKVEWGALTQWLPACVGSFRLSDNQCHLLSMYVCS